VLTVRDGSITLFPAFATMEAGQESHASFMARRIREAIQTLDGGGIVTYQIHGRMVTRERRGELSKLLAGYEAAVWRERNPGRLGPSVAFGFTAP
jgi:hypothetical protein